MAAASPHETGGWYPVALSGGVPTGTSNGTHLFGEEIVVWRDADGAPHIWEDRCPHRGMRLSFGFVRGEALNCLYHGWQYGTAGSCQKIPAHPDLVVPNTIRAGVPVGPGATAGGAAPAADAAAAEVPPAEVPALTVRRHTPQAGAVDLVDVVQGWLKEPGVAPADVAVLARVGSLLLAPHVALVEAGVPVSSILRVDVLGRTGVRAALAYLRIAAAPGDIDPADLVEAHRRPSRGLPRWVDKWLGRCRSIDDVVRASERIDDVKVSVKLADLAGDLSRLAAVARTGTAPAVVG